MTQDTEHLFEDKRWPDLALFPPIFGYFIYIAFINTYNSESISLLGFNMIQYCPVVLVVLLRFPSLPPLPLSCLFYPLIFILNLCPTVSICFIYPV